MPAKTRRLLVADTTLRDGAQTIGVHFSLEAKLQVAEQLAKLGVDVIEIGCPMASPQEVEVGKRAAERLKDWPGVLTAFARCTEKDLEAAWAAVGAHPRAMVSMLASVSDIHLRSKFGKGREEMLAAFSRMVRHAGATGFGRVMVYLEDGTRAEPSYLKELVAAFSEAGAGIVSIPDTVSYVNSPPRYGEIFAMLLAEVKTARPLVLSAHAHNERGLAVANTLAAVQAGAGMVECTINGLGEKAGNASLGTVLLSLDLPGAGAHASLDYGVTTGIVRREYARTAQLVGELGGLGIHYNEPLVGAAVHRTSAGIHQDGLLKARETYSTYEPADYGIAVDGGIFTFNVQSGRKGLAKVLEDMGMRLDAAACEKVYAQVLVLAQQKTPSADDIRAIATDVLEEVEPVVELKVCQAVSGVSPCSAEVLLFRRDTGKRLRGIGYGDGPVSAFMDIVCDLLGLESRIIDYHDVVVGDGREAQMQTFVRCEIGGQVYDARGVSTDIVQAGCRAFMKCVNQHLQARTRG